MAAPQHRMEYLKMIPARILVVDDQPIVARALAAMVQASGHEAVVSTDVEDAMARFGQGEFDAVLSDVKMGAVGGFDLLRRVRERAPFVPVVLITGEATVNAAMEAMEQGAYDYLSKPVRHDALAKLLARAIEHKRLLSNSVPVEPGEPGPTTLNDIIGHSPLMLEAFKIVARTAHGDANVLILGENGTGKEMVARALHDRSDRAGKPFVAVNVGAIVSTLAESELFGHVKGAFTDALQSRQGLFQQAHGGTLFLDEIGDLEMGLQVKLLRAIQERRIKPVGGNEEFEVDIRLVSATNADLEQRVREGRFREDLYFRINVVTIALPPLRDRREDIAELAGYFLARIAARAGRRTPRLSADALAALQVHEWPGNVRELENVMTRAVQFCTDGMVTADLLKVGRGVSAASAEAAEPAAPRTEGYMTLRDKTDEYVREVLRHTGNNMTQAARILGIARRTLQRMAVRRRGDPDPGDNVSRPATN